MNKASQKWSESDLRGALRDKLLADRGGETVLVEELGIEHGAARIDLAVISHESLDGFEIKSDFDTLDRLANQMHIYHRAMDRLTLVTTAQFLEPVVRLLPSWWGIWITDQSGLLEYRAADEHDRQECRTMIGLLWRAEALELLKLVLPDAACERMTRHSIYDALAEHASKDDLRLHINRTLKTRFSERLSRAPKRVDRGDEPFAQDGDWLRLIATS